ncbi:MAG: metalloprotease TldD, partial [Burkholderiaceae bacterium]|nr:metalloprotease TldD [Burkholderiaceae bacterium]
MKPSDPALDRLAVAKKQLLDPYGLDESRLQRTLASIFEHRADYADLYFQYTRSESYSLEEGIVKSGSFDIEQGVGVRAVVGDKTAFAYSDDISLDSLNEAAVSARSIARHGAGKVKVAPRIALRAQPALYGAHDPVASLDAAEKIRLLEKIEQLARARDPRVRQVMANLGAEYDVVLVARSDGVLAADVRPLVRLSVNVIVEDGGRREQGFAGGGGRFDLGYFDDELLADYAARAVDQALLNLVARPAPAGIMPVVLGPGWPGILLHEAIGHGLEG